MERWKERTTITFITEYDDGTTSEASVSTNDAGPSLDYVMQYMIKPLLLAATYPSALVDEYIEED